MGTVSNQSASAQTQSAAQPQDSGEMALAILQDALGDGGAREASTAQEPQSTEGAAATDDNERPEGGAPDTSDENPIAAALAAKEATQKGMQNQHAALTRRARALEAERRRLEQRQNELESKQAELEKIDGIADMVEFVAKRRGIDTSRVWEDVVDQIKNGGKRSQANEALRAINELKREVLELKKPREQKDPEAPSEEDMAEAVANWQSELVEFAKSNEDRWPLSTLIDPEALAIAAYKRADEYCTETGKVPTYEEVMNYLEGKAKAKHESRAQKTQPVPATGNGGAKAPAAPPKQKAKTISNRDAAEAPDARNMSQEDRDAAAMRILEQALA